MPVAFSPLPAWEKERLAREVAIRAAGLATAIQHQQSVASPAKGHPFDCIVVGAGPSGATAAYFLARAGLQVLVLERGPYPGAKGLGGGALYAQMMEPLFPGISGQAPTEGPIVQQGFYFLSEQGATSVNLFNTAFARAPFNRFSVLRARLDSWLGQLALQAGATLLTNHLVEALVFEGDRVTGVRVGSPWHREYRAPVVILAEGAAAVLATRAGLAPKPRMQDMSLYVKECIALPQQVVRERFGLNPGHQAVMGLFGDATAFLNGTASLYTYRDGVGINAGATLENLRRGGQSPHQLLTRIKSHPLIRPLVQEGITVEYTAHMIPDGGLAAVPRLYHPGVLLVGDTAGFVNGVQGINLAAWSGRFAAEAVVHAHRKGDFSARTLRLYRELLEASFLMEDLKANALVPGFYSKHPDFMGRYPLLANRLAYQLAMVLPLPKREKRQILWQELRATQPLWKTAGDTLDALRASL